MGLITDNSLFDPKTVFVTGETDRNKIFKAVYEKLYDLGYVKKDFINNLMEREEMLPMYYGITNQEIDVVTTGIASFYNRSTT